MSTIFTKEIHVVSFGWRKTFAYYAATLHPNVLPMNTFVIITEVLGYMINDNLGAIYVLAAKSYLSQDFYLKMEDINVFFLLCFKININKYRLI